MMSFVLGDYLQWREFTVVISAITLATWGQLDLEKGMGKFFSLACQVLQ